MTTPFVAFAIYPAYKDHTAHHCAGTCRWQVQDSSVGSEDTGRICLAGLEAIPAYIRTADDERASRRWP